MAEGMAEVEQRPQVGGLALVGRHDARLGEAALLDGVGPLRRVPFEDGGGIGLAPVEEGRIVDQPVFHHLGIACQQLAPGQGVEHLGVGQHQPRLVEGADHVLAVAGVDAGLAADRGIDLGEEGGRDLDEVDAAQQDRGGKAREVADDTAAQRHKRGLAVDAAVQQVAQQPAEARELLAALAGRHGHDRGIDTGIGERGGEARAIQRRHRLVAHDDDPRPGEQLLRQRAGAIDQAGADGDVVAAAGQIHADDARLAHAAAPAVSGNRCRRRASITCSVVRSAGCAVDSTTRSASA